MSMDTTPGRLVRRGGSRRRGCRQPLRVSGAVARARPRNRRGILGLKARSATTATRRRKRPRGRSRWPSGVGVPGGIGPGRGQNAGHAALVSIETTRGNTTRRCPGRFTSLHERLTCEAPCPGASNRLPTGPSRRTLASRTSRPTRSGARISEQRHPGTATRASRAAPHGHCAAGPPPRQARRGQADIGRLLSPRDRRHAGSPLCVSACPVEAPRQHRATAHARTHRHARVATRGLWPPR
jgi:hypothetical protein